MNKYPTPLRRVIRAICAPSLMLSLAISAGAQQAPDQDDEEVVLLSPFEVSSERANAYRATDSTSGARIRQALIDTPRQPQRHH